MKNKTIITAATTGSWPTKEKNPNVPLSPEEIAADVYQCWQAGAAIAHLHMRDDQGKKTLDPAKFRETYNPEYDYIRHVSGGSVEGSGIE